MKNLLLLILLVTSCAPNPDVIVDYDREADFSAYHTFDLAPLANEVQYDYPQYDNSLNRKRIIKAVESQLTGKGYEKDTISPDLLVDIHILIQSKKEVRSYPGAARYRYWQDYNINIYDYEEGSLIIDLIDRSQNQLVWQGGITGSINIKPEEVESAISGAVALIFGEYPYRAKK